MNVILPTAGLGARLRPLTFSKPKPLVSVAGKTVLGHVLDSLQGLPLEKLVFVVGYLGEQIERFVRAEYDVPAEFVVQRELKGQADAVLLAKGLVSGPTLILFVDTLIDADLPSLQQVDADGAICVKEVDDPRRFGVAQVVDGRVTRLIEKPDSMDNRLVVVGLYYIRRIEQFFSAIDDLIARDIRTKGEYYLADALQIMIDRGAHIIAQPVAEWHDCGSADTLLETNRYLLDKGCTREIPTRDSVLIPPVYIADGAMIENSVVGPHVSVGAGTSIQNSIVRDTIIGANARLATAAAEASLIGDGAEVTGAYQQFNLGDVSQVHAGNSGMMS